MLFELERELGTNLTTALAMPVLCIGIHLFLLGTTAHQIYLYWLKTRSGDLGPMLELRTVLGQNLQNMPTMIQSFLEITVGVEFSLLEPSLYAPDLELGAVSQHWSQAFIAVQSAHMSMSAAAMIFTLYGGFGALRPPSC
eukprot:SAG11_NODE_15442_length_578_cov_0.968685_1_plen_140_part_00